jgi:hypothetical protein
MPLTLQHTEARSGEPAPAYAWTAGVDGIKDDAPPRRFHRSTVGKIVGDTPRD